MPVELLLNVGRAVVLFVVVVGESVIFTTRVGRDGVIVSVTVQMLVVIAAAAVMVVRGTPRQEQAEEYAAREEQGEA
jgi:hypothetical protein